MAGGKLKKSHVRSYTAYEILQDGMFIEILFNNEEKAKLDEVDGDLASAFSNELPAFELVNRDTDAKRDYEKYNFLNIDEALMPQIMKAHWTKDFCLNHCPHHCSKEARVYVNPIIDMLFFKISMVGNHILFPICSNSYFLGKKRLGR